MLACGAGRQSWVYILIWLRFLLVSTGPEGKCMVARRPVSRGGYTAVELGAQFGKSPRTIRNYVAETRAEYEAGSVARSKPWVALGISRSTWYRRAVSENAPDKKQVIGRNRSTDLK
jgi:hypothetical protein